MAALEMFRHKVCTLVIGEQFTHDGWMTLQGLERCIDGRGSHHALNGAFPAAF